MGRESNPQRERVAGKGDRSWTEGRDEQSILGGRRGRRDLQKLYVRKEKRKQGSQGGYPSDPGTEMPARETAEYMVTRNMLTAGSRGGRGDNSTNR